MENARQSPLGAYNEYLKQGKLAYQFSPASGKVVFYPRIICPDTGSENLEWRISAGLGTVHATTVVHPQAGAPFNVCLIDVDEGFRMMSRVENINPMAVAIGMRVTFHTQEQEGDEPPLPVFMPIDTIGEGA